MERLNFFYYKKDEENLGGDYWKFLNSTYESLKKDDIDLFKINEVIKSITSEELKHKMKNKISDLMKEYGISKLGLERSLDMFSVEEIKQFLEREYNIKIIKYMLDQENIVYRVSDIAFFIDLLKKANDLEWEYSEIINILNIIKDYHDKSTLVKLIEHIKEQKDIYNKLINEYYDYLPEEYKNFINMSNDPNYIYNKSLELISEDLDIGIDPRISIGVEIEANNDYGFKFEPDNQRGFNEYKAYSDATVPNGREVSSIRPLHNIKQEVVKFCGLCEAMKDIGYYYNEESKNTSGQINLGLDYLDSKEAILNFYEIYGNGDSSPTCSKL